MITLTKHHALGNDFLVTWDHLDEPANAAVMLCDRRRGVGADGLLVGDITEGFDARMVLFNADGSRAEMSGNGIRCFAQALAARTSGRTLRVLTDAGPRVVVIESGDVDGTVMASVSMGMVTALPEPAGWADLGCDPMRPVIHLSLGNPHSVVGVEDVGVVDLATLGAVVPHVNLEVVEPGPEPDAVTMRVHERGAGITEACGTGACAVAWAARSWGLVPGSAHEVQVHMDGGDAVVAFDRPAPGEVTLVGPATLVATVTVTVPARAVSA